MIRELIELTTYSVIHRRGARILAAEDNFGLQIRGSEKKCETSTIQHTIFGCRRSSLCWYIFLRVYIYIYMVYLVCIYIWYIWYLCYHWASKRTLTSKRDHTIRNVVARHLKAYASAALASHGCHGISHVEMEKNGRDSVMLRYVLNLLFGRSFRISYSQIWIPYGGFLKKGSPFHHPKLDHVSIETPGDDWGSP